MTICLGLLVHAGCSGGSSPSSSLPELVRRYVEYLNSGDIDKAMSLRCEPARLQPTQRDQFTEDVARLKRDAGGELAVGRVDRVATPRLGTVTGKLGEDEVSFRLRLGDGESSAIHIATVTENGVPKLCGMSIEESAAVRDELATQPVLANPAHVSDLQDVARDATATLGVTTTEDSSTAGRPGSTAEEGWTTAWRTGDLGGGRISLDRYRDDDDALAASARHIDKISADAVSTFSVPSMPAMTGLRYCGSAWTWAQPSDLGPQLDTAIVVYDDVVIIVATSVVDPNDDHSAVMSAVDALTVQING